MKTTPEKNIYWKDIPKGARVELRGKKGSRLYVVNGEAVAYWGGQETKEAQSALDKLAGESR